MNLDDTEQEIQEYIDSATPKFPSEDQVQDALHQLRSKYAGTDYEVRLASELPRDETPQEAAERIWQSTPRLSRKGSAGTPTRDVLWFMNEFDQWARARPERMLAIITPLVWQRLVRNHLQRGPTKENGWARGHAVYCAMRKLEAREHAEAVNGAYHQNKRPRASLSQEELLQSRTLDREKLRRAKVRKERGLKLVQAEVDVTTGAVVNLIDKEYGPFAHIRINGLSLPEATTEEALCYCDNQTADVRFVKALCSLIPDPRKTIGEQWTADIIREAREAASRSEAA